MWPCALLKRRSNAVTLGGVDPSIAALLLASAAATATMLGWVLAAGRRSWPATVYGTSLLVAAGAMVAISSAEILPAAFSLGTPAEVVAGWFGLGVVIVLISHAIADRLGVSASRLERSSWLVAIAIGLHNVPEGAATATTALVSLDAGIAAAIVIGLHNIPEGLAVAAVVMAAGATRARAALLVGIATAGEILGAVAAVVAAGQISDTQAGPLLAAVAGIMISLSVVELLPAGLGLMRNDRQEAAAPADTAATTDAAAVR